MEVKIEFIPQTTSKIEFLEQVKNIATTLIATCGKYGVSKLDYIHDYFKIHIEQKPQELKIDPLNFSLGENK